MDSIHYITHAACRTKKPYVRPHEVICIMPACVCMCACARVHAAGTHRSRQAAHSQPAQSNRRGRKQHRRQAGRQQAGRQGAAALRLKRHTCLLAAALQLPHVLAGVISWAAGTMGLAAALGCAPAPPLTPAAAARARQRWHQHHAVAATAGWLASGASQHRQRRQ